MCRQPNYGFFYCVRAVFVLYLAMAYAIFGLIIIARTFVFEYIESIKHRQFVQFREFVAICLRILFMDKVYPRFKYDKEHKRKGNAYIDKMIEMFNKEEEYDPYSLEDSVVGFNKKVMFVNVSGEAKLYDGHIKGLGTLHRVADCSLHKEEDKLRVRAELGAGELEFHYKGSVKFMNFGPTVTVTGSLSYIQVFMEVKVNSATGKNGRLTKFVIDDMRGMIVEVSGLGPLNWAVNPIISGVTKIFKRFVRNFMENKVEKHLRKYIPNYQFPVEDDEITETRTQLETLPTETEIPEKTPGTEAPEETLAPEPKTSEPELETEMPEETSEPESETEAPEEMELDTGSPEENPEPEENLEVDINYPETPETSNEDESADVGALEELESNS